MSVRWKSRFFAIAGILAGVAALAACKSAGSLKGEGDYIVTAKQTPIYRFGPAQTSGADGVLAEGQRVRMLRREYGYSRVVTDDGEPGFVANDAIAPAPPLEKDRRIASVNPFQNLPPLPSRGTSVPGVSSANRAILQSDPLFGGKDLPPLPDAAGDPNKPGAKPKDGGPKFRVNVPPHSPQPVTEEPKKESP